MATSINDKTIILAQLSLPVHNSMTNIAINCANEVANRLSFTDEECVEIKLTVKEAFCNAVDHFSSPNIEEEQVRIGFFLENNSLIISIRDNGIPFTPEQKDKFYPINDEKMDSIKFLVHGRAGKEVRIAKKISPANFPNELVPNKPEKLKRIRVKEPIIRMAELEDLPEICRLAWRCYGYTQEEFIYDLDTLTKKLKSGEFKSAIAIDPISEVVIGHIGLKHHDPIVKVPELSLAFIDPTYSSPNLPIKITSFLYNSAEKEGVRGIFDCSVTTHVFSQKSHHLMQVTPCAIMLGIAASGMNVKELAISKQDKGSVINHYQPFDKSPADIYVPNHHFEMIKDIYSWMKMPRDFKESYPQIPEGKSEVSMFQLPDELNVTFIIVNKITTETKEDIQNNFRKCKMQRKEAVYAFVSLADPSTPELIKELEKLGFFLAGIIPHIHDGNDRIIMQYMGSPINFEAIRLYGDKARTLFDYIKKEQIRVMG